MLEKHTAISRNTRRRAGASASLFARAVELYDGGIPPMFSPLINWLAHPRPIIVAQAAGKTRRMRIDKGVCILCLQMRVTVQFLCK